MPTPEQLASRIEESIARIPVIIANAEVLAINDILGSMLRRIFYEGKRTDGASIGQYSTKKTLVGAKSFRNKGAADSFFSGDDLEWVRYKGRSLAVLDGGYKALRERQGLEGNFVNLEYSGKLKDSIDIGTFDGKPVIGFTAAKSVLISQGLENKYGQIFYPSKEEIDIAVMLMETYIVEELKKITDSWAL